MARGYKVVWDWSRIGAKGHSGLWSAMAVSFGRLQYRVGKPVRQPEGGGPLAVFVSLEDADAYRREHGPQEFRVYECRYTPSHWRSLWYAGAPMLVRAQHKCPPGTALASSVTLLREVTSGHQDGTAGEEPPADAP